MNKFCSPYLIYLSGIGVLVSHTPRNSEKLVLYIIQASHAICKYIKQHKKINKLCAEYSVASTEEGKIFILKCKNSEEDWKVRNSSLAYARFVQEFGDSGEETVL